MNSFIYNGIVVHRRFRPVNHLLEYKTFSILIDLDEIKILDKSTSLFSYNKFNIYSFYDKDHGERNGKPLKEWVLNICKKLNLEVDINKVKLLCYPRIFGYVFNPLSIFFCYHNDNLKAVFYEVKNTFNEQHTYIFKANNNKRIVQKCKKKFYVSPFMDMNTIYNFEIINPDKKLSISIKQTDNFGIILSAIQTGSRKLFTSTQLIINFFKYPLMTAKIIIGIHFEALLLWKKGAKYRKRDKKIKNNYSLEEGV